MIDPIQPGLANAVQPFQERKAAEPFQAVQRADTDTVTISGPGSLLSSLSGHHLFGADEDGNVTLESMRKAVEEETEAFRSDVAVMLAQAGVRDEPPVELTMDAQGKVRVKGEHPDKETIEALFEENSDLRNRFAALSAGTGMLEAMQEYQQFAKAYAQDPAAAVQQYWYLFEDSDLASELFTLTVGGSDTTEAEEG